MGDGTALAMGQIVKTAVASLIAVALAFQTSRAFADDEDSVARAQFAAPQTSDVIDETVCHLAGAAQIGGRGRALDMRLGERRCSAVPMEEDALAVRVRVEPREGYGHEVIVEVDSSEEVPIQDARTAVVDIGRELRERLGQAPVRHVPLYPPAVTTGEENKRANPGLYTFGVVSLALGGVGVGGGLVVGLGTLLVGAIESGSCGLTHAFVANANCSSNVSTGWIAAGAMVGVGAALMLTGGISMSVGGRKVSAYATGSGGGVRVAF